MKKIILGLIIGLIIATTLNVGAAIQEYILKPVTYPVIVNGEEYISDELPILTLRTKEGDNTYVPLRAMSDMLGVEIQWNGELGRVEIGNVIEEEYFNDNKETKQDETNQSQSSNEYKIYSKGDYNTYLMNDVKYVNTNEISDFYSNRPHGISLNISHNPLKKIIVIRYANVGNRISKKNEIPYLLDYDVNAQDYLQYKYFRQEILPIINNLMEE